MNKHKNYTLMGYRIEWSGLEWLISRQGKFLSSRMTLKEAKVFVVAHSRALAQLRGFLDNSL